VTQAWPAFFKLDGQVPCYFRKYALDEPNSRVPGSTFVFNRQMVKEGAIPPFSRNHNSRTVE